MGAYSIAVFVKHCGPNASNLPGTVPQHLKVAGAIILCNLCLAASGVKYAADIIGKEAVIVTIILFASPLVVVKSVIATKSTTSIPLPFMLASLLRCMTWVVFGWWKLNDFNLYFPKMMGVMSALVQFALKCVYMHRSNGAKVGVFDDIETSKINSGDACNTGELNLSKLGF